MKKHLRVIGVLMVFGVSLCACALQEKGEEGSYGEAGPVIEIVNIEVEGNQTSIELKFDRETVSRDNGEPYYVFGDPTNWIPEEIQEVVKFNLFDGFYMIHFGQGKRYDGDRWHLLEYANITKDKYFSSSDEILIIGVFNGEVFTQNNMPELAMPFDEGDHLIRFDRDGNEVTVAMNFNALGSGANHYKASGSFNDWGSTYPDFLGTTGWATVTLVIDFGENEEITFGNRDQNVNPEGSVFHHEAKGIFVFRVEEDGVYPG